MECFREWGLAENKPWSGVSEDYSLVQGSEFSLVPDPPNVRTLYQGLLPPQMQQAFPATVAKTL